MLLRTFSYLATASLLFSMSGAANLPSSYSFAGLKWDLNKEDTKKALIAKGYEFTGVDDSDQFEDLLFKGKVADEDAVICAIFNKNGELVKTTVSIRPPRYRFMNKYNIVRGALVDKYGKPNYDSYSYDSPYSYGDGFQEDAIEANKATIRSKWNTQLAEAPSEDWLQIEAKQNLSIFVDYNSYKWAAEYEWRNNRDTDDL